MKHDIYICDIKKLPLSIIIILSDGFMLEKCRDKFVRYGIKEAFHIFIV